MPDRAAQSSLQEGMRIADSNLIRLRGKFDFCREATYIPEMPELSEVMRSGLYGSTLNSWGARSG